MTYKSALRYGMQLACGLGLCVSLTGCFGEGPQAPLPEFKPKALDEKARGITIASSKPYNCKIVGETEGYDEVEGRMSGVTRTKIRTGAINDLKNESVHAIKEGQKVMIAISKAEMRCKEYPLDKKGKVNWKEQPKEINCSSYSNLPDNMEIISYRVYGDLYDCGQK